MYSTSEATVQFFELFRYLPHVVILLLVLALWLVWMDDLVKEGFELQELVL